MLQGDSGAWYAAQATVSKDGSGLVLEVAGSAARNETRAVATASGWSLWPITLLYSNEGMIPAFPWNASVN
jgi:hypothetical protein